MENTPMTHEVLRQRYLALETATESRLATFNTRIREERKQRAPNKEKLECLKEKRKEIMQQLNLIREALKSDDLSQVTYQQVTQIYINFDFRY